MDVATELKRAIGDILQEYDTEVNFSLEHPGDISHGDYATNASLIAAKKLNKNPKDVAHEIAAKLKEKKLPYIQSISVAGPGFINITLTRDFFRDALSHILSAKENFGKNDLFSGKKVMVEYTDPNPFKEFHIGHLMPNVIGESVARLYEWGSADVKRVNYQGDVGLHVAKTIWKAEKEGLEMIDDVKVSAEMYAAGNTAYEEDESAKNEIQEINKKIYDRSDEKINKLYDSGRKTSLDYFEIIYAKLGTKFDHYFFESETAPIGKKIVAENPSVFVESEGAIVFKGEEHGLHTRVFINKEGLPTYEAKELGLAFLKEETIPVDVSIVVTANEILEYFKVLLKALSLIAPKLAEKTVHMAHGVLRLPSGKMSSRKGNVVKAEDLIRDVAAVVREKIKTDMSEEEKDEISEKVAIGAIKFSILRQGVGRDIIFDFDKSLSFEGDSGPYLQYTAVRIKSLLEKANAQGKNSDTANQISEIALIERYLPRFKEIVMYSLEDRSPSHLVSYLLDVAGAFNSFYGSTQIIDDTPESSYKLAITEATRAVLQNGLTILGIPVPEKM